MTRDGSTHERWQYKPTLKGDARIWFYIVDHVVYLEQVHTSHPHDCKYFVGCSVSDWQAGVVAWFGCDSPMELPLPVGSTRT